jgi:hypothetical protein
LSGRVHECGQPRQRDLSLPSLCPRRKMPHGTSAPRARPRDRPCAAHGRCQTDVCWRNRVSRWTSPGGDEDEALRRGRRCPFETGSSSRHCPCGHTPPGLDEVMGSGHRDGEGVDCSDYGKDPKVRATLALHGPAKGARDPRPHSSRTQMGARTAQATRSHHRPSGATRSHQGPPGVTSVHQEPAGATRGHQGPPGATSVHQGPAKVRHTLPGASGLSTALQTLTPPPPHRNTETVSAPGTQCRALVRCSAPEAASPSFRF